MIWSTDGRKAGDMIRIRLGAFYHVGIYVSEDEVIAFGLPPVPENQIPSEEVEVTATDIGVFSCGRAVETAQLDDEETRRRTPPDKTVEIARSRIGEKGYNIIHNNCEHFAHECVFGVKKCFQEEAVRLKWGNRPIFDVYIKEADSSSEAKALLEYAAKFSFGLNFDELGITDTAVGSGSCDKFYYAVAFSGRALVAGVSNSEIKLDIRTPEDENTPDTAIAVTLDKPYLITASGEKSFSSKHFRVTDDGLKRIN